MKNILSIEQLSVGQIQKLIDRAIDFRNGVTVDFSQKKAMNLFFEDSTRTHTSFQAAEMNLGMRVLSFDAKGSSVNKGETLYDTVRTIQSIGVDLAVIRHPHDEYYKELEKIDIHIINAGDGKGQHPSQGMLDLVTIFDHFKTFKELKIGIVGDLRHSRVAHSDSYALSKLGAHLFYSGPREWYSEEYKKFGPHRPIDDLIEEMDVIMLLRIQKERMQNVVAFENYLEHHGLTVERVNKMKENAIIMHPAPVNRGVELADEVVECEKSVIFEQMTNGVYARMAMIEHVLTDK